MCKNKVAVGIRQTAMDAFLINTSSKNNRIPLVYSIDLLLKALKITVTVQNATAFATWARLYAYK